MGERATREELGFEKMMMMLWAEENVITALGEEKEPHPLYMRQEKVWYAGTKQVGLCVCMFWGEQVGKL